MNFDPLWVPLLSHYAEDGTLDDVRCRQHVASLRPDVRQYLIAGTTGDGWEMSDAVLSQWLQLCSASLGADQAVLVGAFGMTTTAVLARAALIEAHFRRRKTRAGFVGLTLCAPVDAQASQAAILAHFQAVLTATSLPVAIYQLPQVTLCSIAPETFSELAQSPRVVLFKDTSGADAVTRSGVDTRGVTLLRGAEGDYAAHLKPAGRYDGWLLSSANAFAAALREIARDPRCGEALSGRLAEAVGTLFGAAAAPGANAFADANRAADHIRAFGLSWPNARAPRRADGSHLPAALLSAAATAVADVGFGTTGAYL